MENWKWGIDSSENIKQKIANNWKNWEDMVAKKQTERDKARIDELKLSLRQDFQNEVNSLSDAKEFYDRDRVSSSGATHVPSQPFTVPSPRTIPCRDSGLPNDTRNIVGTSGNVFERLPSREGQPQALFENSKNLASSSQELRLDIPRNTKRPESKMGQNRKIRRYLCHASKEGLECTIILVELILTVVWSIIRDFQFRNCLWEFFVTLWNFKAGKSTSRLKYVRNQ